MDTNELRIGNFVDYKGEKRVVNTIHKNEISFEGNYRETDNHSQPYNYKMYSIKDIYPVPLSEEILLKCGFKKDKSSYKLYIDEFTVLWYNENDMFFNSRFEIRLSKLMYCPGGEVDSKRTNYRIDVEFLHQLQNLYFALIGNELNIKL